MTIERKLQNIVDSKEQIKSAIENKGVTVGSAPLSQYADKINEIQSGEFTEFDDLFKSNAFYVFATNDDDYNKKEYHFFADENGRNVLKETAGYYANSTAMTCDYYFHNNPTKLDYALKGTGTSNEQRHYINKLELPPTIKTINDVECKYIVFKGDYKFKYIESINGQAFANSVMKNVEFSNLTSLGSYAFNASSITSISFPRCTKYINGSLLASPTKMPNYTLGSVGNPVTEISSNIFNFSVNNYAFKVDIYVEDASNPPEDFLSKAPWGANAAEINYLQA